MNDFISLTNAYMHMCMNEYLRTNIHSDAMLSIVYKFF